VGGIPEAAPDGQGAILCRPGDGASMLETITRLRESPQFLEHLGRIGYQIVHSRNAAGLFGSKFVEVYRECLAVKRRWPADPAAVTT
jgi:hypothetical protein